MFNRNNTHLARPIRTITVAAVMLTATSAHANAVCNPQWDNAIGQPGMSATVSTLTVYNGDVIAGGSFATADGQPVNNIARWDGAAWHPFVADGQIGVSFLVRVLIVHNGDLIAGGDFATAGGQTVNHLARWDGSTWHPFVAGGQTGVSGPVFDLTVHNGDLIVGGNFATAGGQIVNNIARWDGSAWHPFSSGGQIGMGAFESSTVRAVEVWNGDLFAGGMFTTAGGQTVGSIARWDGASWHPLESGGQIGVGVTAQINALISYNGNLIVGGHFDTAGGQTVNKIARWDGSAWYPLASGGQIGTNAEIRAMTVFNGDLIAGGAFTTAGGQTVSRIARWDGSAWSAFVSGGAVGTNAVVRSLTTSDNGLIVGGQFTTVGGLPTNHIARWSPVNCTIDIADGDVGSLIDAIEAANASTLAYTINLAPSGTYTLTQPYSTLAGLPTVLGKVTINGNGATIRRSDAEGTPAFRLFHIETEGDLTLNDLTITGGVTSGSGGAIFNRGTLHIDRCTIASNASTSSSASTGGGALLIAGGTATIVNSTLTNNTAATGGAIRMTASSNLAITNSTISHNHALSFGGGIRSSSQAEGLVLSNTIVAANSAGSDGDDLLAPYTDAGFNFIGELNGNPMLGPLADNGGLTFTRGLLPGSPAIDAGDCHGGQVTFDQRGVERPQGLACDIGSFEFDGSTVPCPGDLTGSGSVGVPDLLQLLSCWGPVSPSCEVADLTGSGSVGVPDLLHLLANWGPCP